MLNGTFESINFDTKPTTVQTETVEVTIDLGLMVNDYAKAYAAELQRRNPVRFDATGITVEDLESYFKGLIAMRVASVRGKFPEWRDAKALYIPAWIEFTMTSIGEVYDTDRGLRIIPSCTEKYDLNAMMDISNKLRVFKADGVVLLRDAFPRTADGDSDTMSMAIINDYVCAMDKTAHPIASYVAAYLGFKIKEEAAFKMLYRVRYDDVEYIRTMLMSEEKLF